MDRKLYYLVAMLSYKKMHINLFDFSQQGQILKMRVIFDVIMYIFLFESSKAYLKYWHIAS